MRRLCGIILSIILLLTASSVWAKPRGDHPLSNIAIHKASIALHDSAYIKAAPTILGLRGQNSDWVSVEYNFPNASFNDWIGVFSPANISASICLPESPRVSPPLLCIAPIKYQFANYSNPKYQDTGKGLLKLQLINQREDFSFALFSGGLDNPKLVAVSNAISFANPKAPVYPRLAQGKSWDEMTVTWTSGYGIDEAEPFVEWGPQVGDQRLSPAGTLTFSRNSMCGAPARTVGWRDPGFIHTSFLKNLWPNSMYKYRLGHRLFNGTIVWSQTYRFRASPYPGQDSLQRVVIFGDMGKAEADGSNEYSNYQPGSLNTTQQLINDLGNTDIVFHIGDICYANGYLSQWDQFTSQIEPISSTVPYMIASGNHERDWPGTGSFYGNTDSGGECGVAAETMFYVPADNRAKFWYSTDYGMFHFCIADTEHDWREGSEQYKFIEHCLASADRQKQPWLIFLAHRVLGYSSSSFYAEEGSFEEPMGRESLQKLWQKYNVDLAVYGHVHNYERTCPVYEEFLIISFIYRDHYGNVKNWWFAKFTRRINFPLAMMPMFSKGKLFQLLPVVFFSNFCITPHPRPAVWGLKCDPWNVCTSQEKSHYQGPLNGTIHVVAGGGGAHLAEFTTLQTRWSLYKDYDYGFVKLTAFDHSNLLFEYKKSSDGKVYDSFRITRDYRDILACTKDNCPSTTMAS